MDRRVALVFAVCAAPRLLALAVFPAPAPTYYTELASAVLTTGQVAFDGVPSTYLQPLYPAFLAGARLLTFDSAPAVALIQIMVAASGGVLLYRLGLQLASPRLAVVAAGLYAAYPYLVRQSIARLEITLCTTLAIAATLALTRTIRVRDALVSGACLGLLVLTRAAFAPAAFAAAIWLAWRGRARPAVAMLGVIVIVNAPWFVRNTRIDGAPFPSRIGENLYVSTSVYADAVPVHDVDLFMPLAIDDVVAEVERRHVPAERVDRAIDNALFARTVGFVRERPGHVLWLKVRNALYLVSPLLLPRHAKSPATFARMDAGVPRIVGAVPRPWIQDGAHAIAQGSIMLLAAIGLVRRRPCAADAPLLIVFGAQAAVCIVFFPTTRLMAPVMFVPMFYAGAAFPERR